MRTTGRFPNDWMQPLVEQAEEQGFLFEALPGGHYRFRPPDPSKPLVVVPATPGDFRAKRNVISDLKKSGFVIPRRGKGSTDRAKRPLRRTQFFEMPPEARTVRRTHDIISNDMVGKILSYDSKRGFGFIVHDEFPDNIFFHRSNVLCDIDALKQGTRVRFDLGINFNRELEDKPVAVNVELLVEPAKALKVTKMFGPVPEPPQAYGYPEPAPQTAMPTKGFEKAAKTLTEAFVRLIKAITNPWKK